MFEKNDKKRVYWLIDQYLAGKIDAKTFCDEFYYSYDLEIKRSSLTQLESIAFSDLSIVAGRFSEFEEDHINYPGTYFTEEDLKKKVIETREVLQLQNKE